METDTRVNLSFPPHHRLPRWAWIAVLGLAFNALLAAGFMSWLEYRRAHINVTAPVHQQIADPTAGWQTYRNEKYEFEFRYPKEWLMDPNFNQNDSQILINLDKTNSFMVTVGPIIDAYGQVASLEEFLESYSYDINYSMTDKMINGNNWLRFADTRNPRSARYILVRNDLKYEFILNEFSFNGNSNSSFVSMLDNLISTFKFLEPGVSDSLLKACPDEWIQNDMPLVVGEPEERQYYILSGQRRELAEFDKAWVAANCKLEKQIVY